MGLWKRKETLTPVLGDMGESLGGFGFDLVICSGDRKGFWLMPLVLPVLSLVLLLPTVRRGHLLPTVCRGHCCYLLCAEDTVATYYVLSHA